MSIVIKNTRELLQDFKIKALAYAPSGFGKTEWVSTAPNIIAAGCETGMEKGLLTVAWKGIASVFPETYSELEQFCSGTIPGQDAFDTYAVDGFSYLTDTIIKDYALSIPRKQGDSQKRNMGVPELDDYGVMAELERRLLAKLLQQPKHVIVTCLQDYYQPPQAGTANSPARPEKIGGPDLPGSMRLGSAAMFDVVMRLQVEPVLVNGKRSLRRFWQTEATDKYLAKCRIKNGKTSIFPAEVDFNLETGVGTFSWFLEQAQAALAK